MIYHVFHQPIYGEEYRKAFNAGAEALAKYGATKWFGDDRKNGAMTEGDQDWAFNDFLPRVVAAGWKYWAMVVPEEVHAALSMLNYAERYYAKGVRMMFFKTVDEALSWLDRFE